MINGDIKEFLDKLYCGEELLFEYENVEYFLQGWTENNKAHMVLDRNSNDTFDGYYWECIKDPMKEYAEESVRRQLWNEKTYADIHNSVIWKE